MTSPASFVCVVLAATSALAQEPAPEPPEERRGIALHTRTVLDGDALHRLPAADSYHHLLDHWFLTTMFSLRESMGWSDVEPERLTITGNSAAWTEWRLDELNLSDPVFEGAAAFKVPFAFLSEIEVQSAESSRHPFGGGIRFGVDPKDRPRRDAGLSFGRGGYGDIVDVAHPIMKTFSGLHPRDRRVPPDPDRRRFNGRLRGHVLDTLALGGDRTLRWAVEVDANERHHLDFPGFAPRTASVPFEERSLRTSAIAELAPADRAWKAYALGEYRQRGNLFTERGFSLAETQSLASGGLLAGVIAKSFRAGLTFKHYRTAPNDPDFVRELSDLDGEGFFPFVPTGSMNTLRLDLGYRRSDFYASSDTRLLLWSPDATRTHRLVYQGNPYGSVTLASRDTAVAVGSEKVGYSRVWTLGRLEVGVDGYLALNHAHAGGMESFVEPGLGVEADVAWKLRKGFQPFLAVGATPVPITSQLALALAPGYLDVRETLTDGTLVRTVGGGYTRLGDDLGSTNILSGAFGFTSRFGSGWSLSFQGIVKTYTAVHRLAFDGGPEKYGHFTNGVFFLDDGETRYVLEDTPPELRPFGGALQLDVSKAVPGESFFMFSFHTLNSLGHPPPLSGAWGNDIGLVDWSGANPNGKVNSLANVDADRAYVLRMGGGRRLWRSLWGSFLFAFRDGQPFAFFDHHFEDGQLATTMDKHRGSPLKPDRPLLGPREDFQLEIDAQLSYDVPVRGALLRVKLLCANVFDFGNEVSERSIPGGDLGRSTLETQLPRSLNLAVELLEQPRESKRELGPVPDPEAQIPTGPVEVPQQHQ